MMVKTSLIVAFAIISYVSYTWADCKAKFSTTTENADKLPVTESYKQSRDSIWERFKNIMKGRLVDPICTAKQEVAAALCECAGGKPKDGKNVTKKKTKKDDDKENEETKESCTWMVVSKPDGTSLLRYANMYPCGSIYITQGYAAYDGNLHDVFVLEEKKEGGDVPFYVFQKVLKAVNFDEFKEENHSFWNQLYLQGLSFILNLDKHLF